MPSPSPAPAQPDGFVQRYQALLDVSDIIHACRDLNELFNKLAQCVRRVVDFDGIAVNLLDEREQVMRVALLETREAAPIKVGFTVPLKGVPAVWVLQNQRVLRLRVADNDPEYWLHHENMRRLGIAVTFTFPLTTSLSRLGVLLLAFANEVDLPDSELQFLQRVVDQVAVAVENALAYQQITALKDQLAREKVYLEDEIRSENNFEEIIGESTGLKTVLHRVQTVANSDSTVLILGETGTGKELIARAIHESSPRKGRTFVKLNCAAIPTGLLESELFGHERGAFTGAIAQKIGRMELANGGTLFLDEVGDIPLELQPKLLRALQEREFERLGSVRTQKSDVRFIAATNQNLPKMVADKAFRSDLFYRLNVFPISIPSLRERRDDIPSLVRYFVSKYATKMNKRIDTIPTTAMNKLQSWHWPGNVRELENFVERSVILTTDSDLYVSLAELKSAAGASDKPPETLRETDREHILRILRETRGVLAGPSGAAARLGLKRTTLQYKIKKLGITPADY